MNRQEAIDTANNALRRYYKGEIDVVTCYNIVLRSDVRSNLDGWQALDPWEVIGRPGEITHDARRKPAGERKAIRKQKAQARKPFVIFRV